MTSHRRRFAVVVATFIAVVTAAAGFAYAGDERSTDGPMDPGNPHGWAITEPVGDPFTDGMEILRLDAGQDAVIEAIRLVGDPGLELTGAKLASPERGIGWIQYHDRFPPANDSLDVALIDAVGATVTPQAEDQGGWELLLGIRATAEGYLVREGVEVDYRVGQKEYTVLLPGHLAVCTSPDFERNGECPLPPAE